MKTYPLWAVRTGIDIWVSRGTKEQVVRHITRTPGVRYYTVLDWVPIDAAEKYSKNHAPGWLYREPVRLRKHRDEIGCYNKTVKELIDELVSTAENYSEQRRSE